MSTTSVKYYNYSYIDSKFISYLYCIILDYRIRIHLGVILKNVYNISDT